MFWSILVCYGARSGTRQEFCFLDDSKVLTTSATVTLQRSAIGFMVIALIVFAPVLTAIAAADSENASSNHGISASIIPAESRPGDIVEFRVEMCRETWGGFELQMPNHPQLRTIVEENIPVSYANGLYRQRQSLLLQPVSSGAIVIGGVTVTVSTSDGDQTVELPELTLNVRPFENVALSDSPLTLPPDEGETQASALPFWISLVIAVAAVALLALFVFLRNRKIELQPAESTRGLSPTGDIVDQLRSGVIPKQKLEQLLNDPEVSFSAALQTKIERAVYSVQTEQAEQTEQIRPADLATLLQKELPT